MPRDLSSIIIKNDLKRSWRRWGQRSVLQTTRSHLGTQSIHPTVIRSTVGWAIRQGLDDSSIPLHVVRAFPHLQQSLTRNNCTVFALGFCKVT